MASVVPFRALRFDAGRVGDLGSVWAPPYDVIKGDAAARLRDRHPNNIVRLTNPEGYGADRYESAARTLEDWIRDGVMVRDERPALYVHRHRFATEDEIHVRSGIWALLRLEPIDGGVVLAHEHTMSGPKADRLALMRACRAQLSPVFFICSDPGDRIAGFLSECAVGEAFEAAEFPRGEHHEIWRVSDGSRAERLAALMKDQMLLIADGHHRYETALAYRDERVAAGAPSSGGHDHEYLLAYVVPERDPGLLLLPTHRIVTGDPIDWSEAIGRTEDRFEVRRMSASEVACADVLLEDERGRPSFVLVAGGDPGGWLVRLRPGTLAARGMSESLAGIAAVAFHEVFLPEGLGLERERQGERVSYSRSPGEAMRRVRSGAAQAAALLAPPRVSQVRGAAQAGERTPAKTTYFWPKVPTGVAVHAIGGSVAGERWRVNGG